MVIPAPTKGGSLGGGKQNWVPGPTHHLGRHSPRASLMQLWGGSFLSPPCTHVQESVLAGVGTSPGPQHVGGVYSLVALGNPASHLLAQRST